jgi:hypothetical protein
LCNVVIEFGLSLYYVSLSEGQRQSKALTPRSGYFDQHIDHTSKGGCRLGLLGLPARSANVKPWPFLFVHCSAVCNFHSPPLLSVQHERDNEDSAGSGQRISIDRISLVPCYRTNDPREDGGVFEWNDGSSDVLASGHQAVSIFFGGT